MNERVFKVLEYNKIIDKLCSLTQSTMGYELAKGLVPSSNLREVTMMQDETDEAVRFIMKKGSVPLEGLTDIRGALKKAEIESTLDPADLLKVADMQRCARRMKGTLDEQENENFPIISDIIYSLMPTKSLEDEIYNCILSEEEISDGASTALYNIRRHIKEKNALVRDKLNSIIRSGQYSKYLQDPIITVRGDRFVVPVKAEYRGSFPGLVHDQSASGSTLFIEPMSAVELNNDIRQLRLKEKAEIERILRELTAKVSENIDYIGTNSEVLSQLDFIFAKAKLSIELKCMPPSINNEGYIYIKKGRHPLIDPDIVVPNDITLGKDFNILVITGPNTGGKTVTLKTIGLLTLMALAGLQIPASEGSSISIFDQVFADIGDEQSIEQSLSTFSSHMTNIVGIMKEVTEKSLVLFDELGAGTDPTEGAALAMALLDDLNLRGAKVAATTHYSELKVYAMQSQGVKNASVEFDVETLRPTYKLFIGIPGKSNAFEISKRLGLDEYIINKSRNLISRENLEFEDLISNLQRDKIVAENERQEAERLKQESLRLREDYESRKQRIDKARETVLNEARQEARKILRQAKDEADEIVKEIRKLSEEQSIADKNRMLDEARKRLKVKMEGIEDSLAESLMQRNKLKPIKDLKVGDSVFISTLNKQGIVLSLPDSKGELSVQVGIMKINVHISNLSKKDDEPESARVKTVSAASSPGMSRIVTTSIDLRGQTLDDAMVNVDKYLDDAYLSALNEVTIIHGKGTGVLRQGIVDMLKHHHHVKSFRPGKYGEGGIGVTVVEIDR